MSGFCIQSTMGRSWQRVVRDSTTKWQNPNYHGTGRVRSGFNGFVFKMSSCRELPPCMHRGRVTCELWKMRWLPKTTVESGSCGTLIFFWKCCRPLTSLNVYGDGNRITSRIVSRIGTAYIWSKQYCGTVCHVNLIVCF